jgi:lysylphosphatidylglycerol synthetase-like protein (DUF2156 family)
MHLQIWPVLPFALALAVESNAIAPQDMPLWPYHGLLVATGFILLLCGAITARRKSEPMWLRTHKILALSGAAITYLGAATAFYMVATTTGKHFAVPHAYLGALVDTMIFITLLLGLGQFKLRSQARTFRRIHPWAARTTLVLMGANILAGLKLVGLI